MQSRLGSTLVGPTLGSVNLALISIYFFPVWGRDAVRALISPFYGLEDRALASAAIYIRELFDLGFNGMVLIVHIIAGIKLVIAAAFVAYLIEFGRALVTGRETDRETVDVVLILAAVGMALCALPALALGDMALIRPQATQVLMVAGAMIVISVERHIASEDGGSRPDTAGEALGLAPPATLKPAGAALVRIPDLRQRNVLAP